MSQKIIAKHKLSGIVVEFINPQRVGRNTGKVLFNPHTEARYTTIYSADYYKRGRSRLYGFYLGSPDWKVIKDPTLLVEYRSLFNYPCFIEHKSTQLVLYHTTPFTGTVISTDGCDLWEIGEQRTTTAEQTIKKGWTVVDCPVRVALYRILMSKLEIDKHQCGFYDFFTKYKGD